MLIGAFVLCDVLKPEAAAVVQYITNTYHTRVCIASGDTPSAVYAVSDNLGVPRVYAVGGLLPQDKATLIARLQREGHIVCFLGDGVNDSPGLTQADVGIAVSSAAALSMSTASVVMMKSDLRRVLIDSDGYI